MAKLHYVGLVITVVKGVETMCLLATEGTTLSKREGLEVLSCVLYWPSEGGSQHVPKFFCALGSLVLVSLCLEDKASEESQIIHTDSLMQKLVHKKILLTVSWLFLLL